jgi:hypothetical protein
MAAPSTPQPIQLPETMQDMMQMVGHLREKFGDELMYMAWANHVQTIQAQHFNLAPEEPPPGESMEWTDLTGDQDL